MNPGHVPSAVVDWKTNLQKRGRLAVLLAVTAVALLTAQRCPPTRTFTWQRIPHNPSIFEFSNPVQMNSIVFSQGKYIVVGHERIGYSYRPIVWSTPNGITWSVLWKGSEGDGSMRTVIVARTGRLIAGGYTRDDCISSGGVVWSSSDGGSTWNRTLLGSTVFDLITMDSSTSKYLAVGCDRGAASSWTSSDGVSWVQTPNDVQNLGRRDISGTSDWAMYGVTRYDYDSQGTIAFAAAGARHEVIPGTLQWIYKPLVWMSTDGVSWHKVELPRNPQYLASTRAKVLSGCGGGILYAMGMEESASSSVAVWETTNNGVTWSRVDNPSAFQGGTGSSINTAMRLAGSNRLYAAGSLGSKAAYWTVDPSGGWGAWQSAAFETSPRQAIEGFYPDVTTNSLSGEIAVGWAQVGPSSSKTVAAVWRFAPTGN